MWSDETAVQGSAILFSLNMTKTLQLKLIIKVNKIILFKYVNWAKGEPNSENENCVHMYAKDGSWNDALCSIEKCEKNFILY